MGFLKSMFGAHPAPPPPGAPHSLRDILFGDLPVDRWTGSAASVQPFPWSAFASARAHLAQDDRDAAIRDWRSILDRPGLEPRHYLQAWHFLRQHGIQPPDGTARQVLGVVVEVSLPQGLDLVAAYPNGFARYYNFSGKSVIWEHPNNSLDDRIDALLAAADRVVARIGTWNQARPPAPPAGQVRLCFLTPSGLHFGQARIEIMEKDPIGAEVLFLAGGLMQALIDRTLSPAA